MKLRWLLFPGQGVLFDNEEIKNYQRRIKRVFDYHRNLETNRLKRQGTDATQEQKKNGSLPYEDFCIKCKKWCNKKRLQYHHWDDDLKYAVVPTCPKCHKMLDKLKRRLELEASNGQLSFDQLLCHEVDKKSRNDRIFMSVLNSMEKEEFPFNNTEKIVIND